MDNRKSMLWILAVLMMAILACSPALADAAATAEPAEAAEPADVTPEEPLTLETVLATVNGADINYAQVKKYYDSIVSQYGSMMDVNDPEIAGLLKQMAVSYAVTEQLIMQEAAELGLDQLTDEELANMRQAADDTYQNVFDQYLPVFAAEGKSEDEQAQATDAFLASYGYTREDVFEQMKNNELYTRVMDTVTKDLTMDEEELKAAFDSKVEEAKAAYEKDKSAFDSDNMGGGIVYFVPEGVRAVKHILVMMDQAEAAELKALKTQLEGLEAGDPLIDEVQGKIDAMMAVVQPKLDEIQAKIDAGESFQSLIDAYGEDPGMKAGSAYAETGYYLTDATTIFEVPFTQAALALEKVGDISEPVLGARGFHIIQYDHDVVSEAADFDAVKADLEKTELAAAKQKAESDAVGAWTETADITTYVERFN